MNEVIPKTKIIQNALYAIKDYAGNEIIKGMNKRHTSKIYDILRVPIDDRIYWNILAEIDIVIDRNLSW